MALLFTWEQKFSTGIDEIDTQHKQLFNLINKLNETITLGESQQILIRAMDKLVAYTYYHFDAEENFMRQNGYPEPLFLDHQVKHRAFIKKIAKEQLRCATDPKKISMELLNFFMDWFTDHILDADKHMALTLFGGGQSIGEASASYIIEDPYLGTLQEKESRFIALVDCLPAFIWLKDERNRLVYCNKHWHQVTGLTSCECSTDAWLNCIHQDDRDRLLAEYARAFRERSPLQTEYRLIAHDGTCLWILENAAPRILEGDEFAGFMGCGMNISRQKQVESALALSVEQLEEMVREKTQELLQTNELLNREKEAQWTLNQKLEETKNHLIQSWNMAAIGQLAAGIAHEINNPLDTIHANLNTLKHYLQNMNIIADIAERLAGQLPDENTEAMAFDAFKKQQDPASLIDDLNGLANAAMESVNRSQKLVQNLCEFSRINKKDKDLFNIEENLDAILTIINSELTYKAEIVKDYGGIKPIHCIGSQLNQVFMNLLTNAAHAIEDFGRITVRTGYKDAHWLRIEIEDTGTGIPDSIKSKIFEPFLTTQPTEKVLGLLLSRKIIEDHQGELIIDSTLGKGTRFTIHLPIN
jgi:two-component system NtrC family sensor kinase